MPTLTSSDFYRKFNEFFPFIPTEPQSEALKGIADFVSDLTCPGVFVLKGYAGTGKTTLLAGLVEVLNQSGIKVVLMAPTGRAAKVMSLKAGVSAHTIHKKIYFPKKQSNGGMQFSLAPNKHTNTLFIVDEASMISTQSTEGGLFQNGSLLDDLMQFVAQGKACKLMLVGDHAQLPPVGQLLSPALNPEFMDRFGFGTVAEALLDQVVRQAAASGILSNATALRAAIADETAPSFLFDIAEKKDIVRLIEGQEILEAIEEAYSQSGPDHVCFIVQSNKRANLYNQSIRSRILFHEHDLCAGDQLMVVKNNYFWLPASSEAGFIANGDIIEILQIYSFKELYGFKFAEVKVQMVDYPHQPPFDTVLLLDVLDIPGPALPYEQANQLYLEVQKDYADTASSYRRLLQIKNNPFFNALQVKFSYAITCHKAQGGQWDTVFIEQPYLPDGLTQESMRWLYTAMTRAKKKLYLIGFDKTFFD